MSDKALTAVTPTLIADTGDYIYAVVGGNSRRMQVGRLFASVTALENITSLGGRTAAFSDTGFDVLWGWDDSIGAYRNFTAESLITDTGPASGDFDLFYQAGGPLRKKVWNPSVAVFATKAAATAATINASVNLISLTGYTTHGDAPVAQYKRSSSQPSHQGRIQSADGSWWELVGPVIWPEQFGAVGDGVTDDVTAIQNAETARAALLCELQFMAKSYYCSNISSWAVLRPRWRGADHNATLIIIDGSSSISVFLTAAGAASSGYINDIVLWAPSSRTTGQALRLDGDTTNQPDEFTAYNLKITGTGSWDIPLYMYGGDRSSPLGVRLMMFFNLFIGRDISAGVYAETVVQLQIYGGGIYGGTSNELKVTGASGRASTDCIVMGFKINTLLNIDWCTASSFDICGGGVTLSANSSKVKVSGTKSGTLSNSGTNNNTAALA